MPLIAKQFDQPLNSWSWHFPDEVIEHLTDTAKEMIDNGRFEIVAAHLSDCSIRFSIPGTAVVVTNPSHDDREGCALAVASALNELAGPPGPRT